MAAAVGIRRQHQVDAIAGDKEGLPVLPLVRERPVLRNAVGKIEVRSIPRKRDPRSAPFIALQ